MSIQVKVNTYIYSVTYLADNIIRSLQDIIRLSGLSPGNLANSWDSVHRAMRTWLESKDLEKVVLEIYDPQTDELVTRWDVEIVYGWDADNSRFWTDTEQLRYAILKAGVVPSKSKYEVSFTTKSGRPDVPGWGPGSLRSTDKFIKQSLGTTLSHSGLDGPTSYYRKR
jgi:hypothetical protein